MLPSMHSFVTWARRSRLAQRMAYVIGRIFLEACGGRLACWSGSRGCIVAGRRSLGDFQCRWPLYWPVAGYIAGALDSKAEWNSRVYLKLPIPYCGGRDTVWCKNYGIEVKRANRGSRKGERMM